MFGWFNKRRIREQIKLVYQNQSALNFLGGWVDGKGDEQLRAQLDRLQIQNAAFTRLVSANKPADANTLEQLLVINKSLRRLFDATAMKHVHSFDRATEPAMGWESYIDARQDMSGA